MATYCFMESCCFVMKEKCLQLESKIKALGTCNLMQMKNISVFKLTKQPHESWQRMSCTLPQAGTFALVRPCLCQYLIQNWKIHAGSLRKMPGTRKIKIEIKFHKSIVLSSLWKLWSLAIKPRHCRSNFESTGVPSLEKKSAARPGRNLFLGIFLFDGEQWNVRNLIPLNSLVLYW